MKSFVLMLQFLTRIPINIEIDIKEDSFSKGTVYFPLVGLIIGLINGLTYYGFTLLFSGYLPIVFVVLVNILVTGALHLDGLADTCDGIFSARKKERMLEIMKDSRLGTNGAIAIFFELALRIAFMSYIPSGNILRVIIAAPIISRTVVAFFIFISSNSGNGNGLGSLFIGKVTLFNTLIAELIGGGLVILLIGFKGLIILGVILVFIYGFKKYIQSKLGVITGDILGAANELSEILVLIVYFVIEGCLK